MKKKYKFKKKFIISFLLLLILVTASLIYNKLDDWFEFCNHLKSNGVLKDFLICTSYDIIGRFDGIKLALWKNTIKKTQKFFPELEFHTETIITEGFLQAVLNKEFNIKNFKKEYNCRIDYIVPFIGYGNLYKTKD